MKKPATNMAASVRQRLMNIFREKGGEFQILLIRYALERFLFRLSQTAYQPQFCLKGAMMFVFWGGEPHRPTKDLDLLGYGTNTISSLESIFREICLCPVVPDGIEFLSETVKGVEIKHNDEYHGVRITLTARLDQALIPLQIDIGFGDLVVPAPQEAFFPTLLEMPAPQLRMYCRETVIAEKFQALVELGMGNTRLKDFYDIWVLIQRYEFEGTQLSQAISATFTRRMTTLVAEPPLALTGQFALDPTKNSQWKGFLKKNRFSSSLELVQVTTDLWKFFSKPVAALVSGMALSEIWIPADGWKKPQPDRLNG